MTSVSNTDVAELVGSDSGTWIRGHKRSGTGQESNYRLPPSLGASLPTRFPYFFPKQWLLRSPLPSQCTLALCVLVTSLLFLGPSGGRGQHLETGLVLGSQAAALRPRCLRLTEGPALDLTPSVEDWFSDVRHLAVPSTRAEWDSENMSIHGSTSQDEGVRGLH